MTSETIGDMTRRVQLPESKTFRKCRGLRQARVFAFTYRTSPVGTRSGGCSQAKLATFCNSHCRRQRRGGSTHTNSINHGWTYIVPHEKTHDDSPCLAQLGTVLAGWLAKRFSRFLWRLCTLTILSAPFHARMR